MRISDWSSDVCSSDLLSRAIILGKRFRAPAWRPASGAGDNPDLEQCSGFVLQIIFAMTHAGPGTHDLDIARLGSPCVAQAVLMRNGALRSEEHTSELQSLMRISYAVFCLKKKKKNKQ